MTIPPVIVPSGARRAPGSAGSVDTAPGRVLAGRVPPLAALAPFPRRAGEPLVYRLASIDDRGRIADLVAARVLGWAPRTRLAARPLAGVVVMSPDPQGQLVLTQRGHPRLTAPLRRWCGLAAGDRVLLLADPPRSRLVVVPPVALDQILAQALGGLTEAEGP